MRGPIQQDITPPMLNLIGKLKICPSEGPQFTGTHGTRLPRAHTYVHAPSQPSTSTGVRRRPARERGLGAHHGGRTSDLLRQVRGDRERIHQPGRPHAARPRVRLRQVLPGGERGISLVAHTKCAPPLYATLRSQLWTAVRGRIRFPKRFRMLTVQCLPSSKRTYGFTIARILATPTAGGVFTPAWWAGFYSVYSAERFVANQRDRR